MSPRVSTQILGEYSELTIRLGDITEPVLEAGAGNEQDFSLVFEEETFIDEAGRSRVGGHGGSVC
jgi:hypothetical protein